MSFSHTQKKKKYPEGKRTWTYKLTQGIEMQTRYKN